MRPHKRNLTAAMLGGLLLLAGTTGCPPAATQRPPFVPMPDAIRRLNDNNARLAPDGYGLKGSPVEATGRLRRNKDSAAMTFSLAGSFRFSRPRYFVLLLRENATSREVMQAGTNDAEYWLMVQPEVNTLWWGTYENLPRHTGVGGREIEDMPFRPDQLIEVLGLTELPCDTSGPNGPVYRPEENRNVLIFIEYDDRGQAFIQKEYYLDRFAPYLVREIIFRRPDGRIELQAALSDFKPLDESGAIAARKVRIEWPAADSWLELKIRRLKQEDGILRTTNPRELGVPVSRQVCVDEWLTPLRTNEPPATSSAPASQSQPGGRP